MKRNLRVFISYSHRDRKAAERVAETIRNEGHEAWWDEDTRPGANWAAETAEALNRSQAIYILISPNFMESDYAQKKSTLRYPARSSIVGSFLFS
jgi:internalin A